MGEFTTDVITQILIAIFGSSVIASFISGFFSLAKWNAGEKNESNAVSAKTLVEASAMLIEPLKEQIEELDKKFEVLKKDYRKMEKELRVMKDWAERLAKQVISLGGTPVKRAYIHEEDIKLDEVE